MKKHFSFLFLLCLLPLSACGGVRISGDVTRVFPDGEGALASFVLRSASGQQTGIVLTPETTVLSLVDGVTAGDFQQGAALHTSVSVTCGGPSRTLPAENGDALPAREARSIQITAYLAQENGVRLPDGTGVDIWNSGRYTTYKLANGAALLEVQQATGPNDVYVAGIESFDDLSEPAQAGVLAYFDAQGLLYDMRAELAKAYAAYQKSGKDAPFQTRSIGQDISPTASSDRVMYFMTSVRKQGSENQSSELRLGAAFDRETGKILSAWDLFSCPAGEAKTALLDMAGVPDPVLRAEMERAFDPSHILLFPDTLEISFPQGTLPSQPCDYLIGLDYDKSLRAILRGWAVPTPAA